MKKFFPGMERSDLPGGLGWAVEHMDLSTHSGMHMDAPYHYHPTMDKGRSSMTIDEVPLEWCMSDGVILDLREKGDGDRITVEDIRKALDRIRYDLKPLDIVLIHTGADQAWGTERYLASGAGMDREGTLFLTEQGIRVCGIDAWRWDRPLPFLAEEFESFRARRRSSVRAWKCLPRPISSADQPSSSPANSVCTRNVWPGRGDLERDEPGDDQVELGALVALAEEDLIAVEADLLRQRREPLDVARLELRDERMVAEHGQNGLFHGGCLSCARWVGMRSGCGVRAATYVA